MKKTGNKRIRIPRALYFLTALCSFRSPRLSALFHLLPRPAAVVLFFTLLSQGISPVYSADTLMNPASGEELLVVFDFESERGLYKETAILLTDLVRNEIANEGKYKIMERDLVASLLGKHTFIMTMDLPVEYAVEAGRALKVKTAIIGYLSKKNDTYYLRLSRINVSTGSVQFVVEDKCSGGKEELARLSKTTVGKLLGDVKVVLLRPALRENNRFVVNALSILDTATKLDWMRDANSAEKTLTWDEAITYLGRLNEPPHESGGEWRLPAKEELSAILEYAKSEGVRKNINELYAKIGFKNMKAEYYWSATTAEEMAGLAWVLDLYSGELSTASKSGRFYVWPVRAAR